MVPTDPQSPLLDLIRQMSGWCAERPWLAAVAATFVVAAVSAVPVIRAALWRGRHQRLTTGDQQIRIIPPPEVDPAGAGAWWANMHDLLTTSWRRRLVHGTPHIALEYRWQGRELTIVVWVPGVVSAAPVAAAVRAAWPGAACTVEDATAPIPFSGNTARGRSAGDAAARAGAAPRVVGGALAPALPGWYLLTTDQKADPMRPLVTAGAGLRTTEAACVQILARPATTRQITGLRRGAAALRTGQPASGGMVDPTQLLRGALTAVTGMVTGLVTGTITALSTPGPSRRAGAAHTDRGRAVDPLRDRDARPAIDKTVGPLWQAAVRYAVADTGARAASDATSSTTSGAMSRAMSGAMSGAKSTAKLRGMLRPGSGAGFVAGFRAGSGAGSRAGTNAGSDAVARRLGVVAHGLASAFGIYAGRNRLRRMHLPDPAGVLANRPMRHGFLLNLDELAALAGLPTDVAVPGLDRARAKAVPAPIDVPTGGRSTRMLGVAEVGGHKIALPITDARQHIHLLGSTGSGKSTLMCHLILDDITARRGVVVIDPKGDLVLDILDRLPASVADRVVLIDPDQPGGATLNPLQGLDDDLIVDNIVSIFSRIFQRHWGPRIDDVLRVACLTLMRKANATLTLVPPLLQGHQFRAEFTADLDDPAGLLGFWEWYESVSPPLRAQIIAPVLSRLRAFLLRDFVKATLGVPTSSFSMGDVLDHGGILLARLPKGQIGEETAKLMGSFVFASAWQAATARARTPEPDRRDASIYVDEAHNVLNLAGSVSDMLAEARGYHLSLVLAHQNLTQLPRDTQLALSANARNKIFFSCSPEDAHQLARHTMPELDAHDLSHLDAYTAAARLVVGSRETAAFTLRTRGPAPLVDEALAIRQQITRTEPAEPTGVEQLARRSRSRDERARRSATGSTATGPAATGPTASGRRQPSRAEPGGGHDGDTGR